MLPGSSSILIRTTKGSTVTLAFRIPGRIGGTGQQLNVSAAMSHVPGHTWPGTAIPPPCWLQVRDSNIPCGRVTGTVVTPGEIVPVVTDRRVIVTEGVDTLRVLSGATCSGVGVAVAGGAVRGAGPGMLVHPEMIMRRMIRTATRVKRERLRTVMCSHPSGLKCCQD